MECIVWHFGIKYCASVVFCHSFSYLRKKNIPMKKILSGLVAVLALFAVSCGSNEKVYYASDFGIVPGTGEDMPVQGLVYEILYNILNRKA